MVDHRTRRIRRPVDLLRSLISALGIVVAVGIGLLAHATAAGVEIDAVGAGRKLPDTLLTLFGVAAAIALLLLPVALAVRQISRRQSQQLVEAVLAGAGTIALVALINTALRQPAAAPLYDAIAGRHPGASTTGPLDGYLAGLIAYATIIGLTSPSRWRTGLWLAVGVYAVASLTKSQATVLSLVITLLLGRAIGLAVRYAAGSWSQRPTAEQIAAALSSAGQALTAITRTRGQEGFESRHYSATVRNGDSLDIRVFDRDQEAAGAAYRLYRWARLQGQARRGMPFSLERTVERQALLAYAADEAGVRTPRLRALTRVGADAFALAQEHAGGTTLAELAASPDGSRSPPAPAPSAAAQSPPGPAGPVPADGSPSPAPAGSPANAVGGARPATPNGSQTNAGDGSQTYPADGSQQADSQLTDDKLRRVWETVRRLHAHRVTHRALTADRIMLADDGGVVLLDPGLGDVAATDLQMRLDLAQLLAEMALLVGPDRDSTIGWSSAATATRSPALASLAARPAARSGPTSRAISARS